MTGSTTSRTGARKRRITVYKPYRLIACLLIFMAVALLIGSISAGASSGYIVSDHDVSQASDPLTDSSGADRIAPIWDAPPVTLIEYGIAALALSIGMLGLFPIIGKVKELLSNENRKRIYEYIVANPACTIASLADGLHMNIGTVDYHLFQLKCRFKVKIVREGKFRRVYDNAKKFSFEEQVICSYVRSHVSNVLLGAILNNPGITQKKLSEIANLDASTMSYYSNKFLSDGLIIVEKDGRFKRYFISAEARPLLEKHMAYVC